jgi:hypothetical protein
MRAAGRSAARATASSPPSTARRAITCAQRAVNAVGNLQPVIRSVYTGEVELVGDKVEGIAVAAHIGAPDRGRGTAVRVLVSGIVKGLTAGQHRLTDRGTRTLKGVPESGASTRLASASVPQ